MGRVEFVLGVREEGREEMGGRQFGLWRLDRSSSSGGEMLVGLLGWYEVDSRWRWTLERVSAVLYLQSYCRQTAGKAGTQWPMAGWNEARANYSAPAPVLKSSPLIRHL